MKPIYVHIPNLFDRTPPHSEESEQALLGAMIIAPSCIDEVATIVEARDFYSDANRAVFASITFVHRETGELDLVTLINDLERVGQMKDVGGQDYLVKLAKECPGPAGVMRWAKVVKENSCLRRVIDGAAKTIYDAYHADRGIDALSVAQSGIDRLAAAAQHVDSGRQRTLGQAARELVEQIDSGASLVEKSGYAWFDQITGGFPKAGVITLIGQNAHGKTTFGLTSMFQLALQHGGMGVIHSVEQPPVRVSGTLMSVVSGMNVHAWANAGYKPTPVERHAMSEAIETLDRSGIVVDPENLDAGAIYRKSCMALRKGHRRIMIDYIQDLKPMPDHKNDAEGMAESMRILARIATELNMQVFVVSQMDKAARQLNKTPSLNDGRGSGAISDRADMGISIHRPHFNTRPEDQYDTSQLDRLRNQTDITVVKNKYGRLGTVTVQFDGRSMSFRPE